MLRDVWLSVRGRRDAQRESAPTVLIPENAAQVNVRNCREIRSFCLASPGPAPVRVRGVLFGAGHVAALSAAVLGRHVSM